MKYILHSTVYSEKKSQRRMQEGRFDKARDFCYFPVKKGFSMGIPFMYNFGTSEHVRE